MSNLAVSLGLANTNTMSMWYCCKCSFGPHNTALHEACINCGNERCGMCVDEKLAQHSKSYSHDHHEPSPYPSVTTLDTAHTLSLETSMIPPIKAADVESPQTPSLSLPEYTLLSSQQGIPQSSQHAYMYYCCQCQDGPKLYNVQPVCVICDHEACWKCTYVK